MGVNSFFGTDGIRGVWGKPPLTPHGVWAMGLGVGHTLRNQERRPWVLLARDTRESSIHLEQILCGGLLHTGVSVESVGVAPTPSMSFLVPKMGASMGLVISASHNPYEYNGIKFFNTQGEKISLADEAVLQDSIEQQLQLTHPTIMGQTPLQGPFLSLYEGFLQEKGADLQGLRVMLDCAHGACAGLAERVFRACGAVVLSSIGSKPNGKNINQGVGSLYPQRLCEALVVERADVGFAFDGDGDRVILVDPSGAVMDGDQLLACLCGAGLGPGVVGTEMSNEGLVQHLAHHGYSFLRAKVGDRHVADKLKTMGWKIGGEPCGHVIISPFLPTGDGLLVALWISQIMVHHGNPFPLFHPFPSVLHNVPLFFPTLLEQPKVRDHIQEVRQGLQHESLGKARLLLRVSGTEPIVRILVEGPCLPLIERTADALATYLRTLKAS